MNRTPARYGRCARRGSDGQGPPNGWCHGARMAGRPAAARCGKDGRAADPPWGHARRSLLWRQRGDL